MFNHVLMSLKLWSMIATYRRTANKDRKKQLTIWMTGKVTETIYIKTCVVCSALSNKMKKCSGCYTAYYCSEECQKLHWPTHEQESGRDIQLSCLPLQSHHNQEGNRQCTSANDCRYPNHGYKHSKLLSPGRISKTEHGVCACNITSAIPSPISASLNGTCA